MRVLLFSGGKDSLATFLYLREKGIKPLLLYHSYGYELVLVWDYFDYLHRVLGVDFVITKPKVDFLEIFKEAPTLNVPRCRQYVKIAPFRDFVKSRDVEVAYLGLRADEKRGCPKHFAFECPLKQANLGLSDVYNLIAKAKVKLHPFYSFGFSRVGCVPCPAWGKRDLVVCLKFDWCRKLLFKVLDVVFSFHSVKDLRRYGVWYLRAYYLAKQRFLFD